MYKKVPTDLSLVDREKQVLQFWKDNEIFEKTGKLRENGKPYVFYDGPPTANGVPHIGHVITRVIKDLFPRYRTMKGYQVPRKAGWDTHGLPVELEVEKLLGINGKDQIEAYGLADFVEKCKESVWKYKGMWEDFSDVVGYWVDMENPYVTYHNDYIESVWWSLKQIHEKDLLYKGFKIVPYCPRCGTPLSSHEVAQGYKDVKERSAVVKFKLKDDDAYMLAWTTTPWTLPSNTVVTVNPRETYAKVECEGEKYILAKELLESVLGEREYTILETFTGKEMEYWEYEPLFDFVKADGKCWFVTCADYVTLSDGTGIVHSAPAFGEDDAQVGRAYNLPFIQLVDAQGRMKPETDWPGVFVKDADPQILTDLANKGLLFASPSFEHSYPHCWRCDSPLIYYARDSWFIEMSKVKDKMIANNNKINWIPENIGKGRFGDWLENLQDWAISRDRYWGTPLNIWTCDCGHRYSIGSIAELKELSDNCPDDIELHRPYIDEVTIKCPDCGEEMHRVPEVIDCWYDSGAMPFAQLHYPFENKELFEREFPADFISEAVDQTRGWFYSLLAISTLIFDEPAFKNVIVLGHVQDADGQKMSKSKGNAVEPMEALGKFGADAIRWYFMVNSAPWLPSRFSDKTVIEGQRKFLGTLWNTYAFFVLYADIHKFDPREHKLEYDKLSLMDKWLLSRLNHTVKLLDEHFENFRVTEAARCVQEFVEELSNWYVRRGRERYWADGMEQDQVNAFLTLYTALVTISKAAAPQIPFMTEQIYQNLVCTFYPEAPESVHLCDYPVADESMMDADIEAQMEKVLEVVTLGRAARNGANLKNRQPLAAIYVGGAGELSEPYSEIIRDELNMKQVVFAQDLSALTDYSFKPQLKTVGPKYGKQVGEIRNALAAIDGTAAKNELDSTGVLKLSLPGGDVELTEEDLLIDTKQREGFYSVEENGIVVAIDTTLTEKLVEEGFVREVVSKLQQMRKEAGFEVLDRIRVTFSGSEKVAAVVEKNKAEIAADILADEMTAAPPTGFVKESDVNGETVTFGVEKV